MKLPRDLSGSELIARLARLGYAKARQTGSHVRLTTSAPSTHHITIPLHSPLRVGTLASILAAVAKHHAISMEALVALLQK